MMIGFAYTQSIANSQIRGKWKVNNNIWIIISPNKNFFYSGLYGVYFPNNSSAFTAAAMGLTIGLALGAFASTNLCVYMKVYIYLALVMISLICYVCLSFKHNRFKKVAETKNGDCLEKNEKLKLTEIKVNNTKWSKTI